MSGPLTPEEYDLALAYGTGVSGIPIHPRQYEALVAKRDELGSDAALADYVQGLFVRDVDVYRWPSVCLCHENDCLGSRCRVCDLVDTMEEPPPCTTDPELLVGWGEEFVNG